MQLNVEEKQQTISRLTEMFNVYDEEFIRRVCEQFDWNVEHCVDYLIKCGDDLKVFTASQAPVSVISNAQFQVSGAIPKDNSYSNLTQSLSPKSNKIRRTGSSNNTQIFQIDEQKLMDQIESGCRVMVLMRGAPGSGKSHLAKTLVQECVPLNGNYDLKDFIFSSDDYFLDAAGRYRFDVQRLDEVHSKNQNAVKRRAADGWSPIVVDNTNIKLWEMLPYVQMATQFGYIIKILEPKTPWRNSAGKLAMRNSHGVTREKIQIMLDRYEKATVDDLLRMIQNPNYSMTVPLIRKHPPPPLPPPTTTLINQQKNIEFGNDSGNFNLNQQNQELKKSDDLSSNIKVKPQRELFNKTNNTTGSDTKDFNQNDSINAEDQTSKWQYFQTPFQNFLENAPQNDAKENQKPSIGEKSLLDLLKEGFQELKTDSTPPNSVSDSIGSQLPIFQRHNVNCQNENKSFISLRQIYPNKSISGLWDLFIKCNGDVDWAVDILLKEDELSLINDDVTNSENEEDTAFFCDCNNPEGMLDNTTTSLKSETYLQNIGAKPQRLKVKLPRQNQRAFNDRQEVKETIENCFIIGDEHYSPHLRKIRDIRNGILDMPFTENLDLPINENFNEQVFQPTIDQESQTELIEEEDDEEGTDIIEVTLGEVLVKQLKEIFTTEMSLGEKLPDELITNVFLPRSLAKELYILWMESVYNHVEEQRHQSLREDEQFARLIMNPKYENCKSSPTNARELLDMEMAWKIYKRDLEDEKLKQFRHQPVDLASHLTQMKLFDKFPNIPQETLLDVLAAHNNKYNETVEVLHDNVQINEHKNSSMTHDQLYECVKRENELLNLRVDEELRQSQVQQQQQQQQQIQQQQQQQLDQNSVSSDSGSIFERSLKSGLPPEESKRLALRDFEDTRNLAAHHCQLKAECYQKAKEAIQKGNSSVAVYYSQIANFHKKKIDIYNHRAANCIIEVHKYTQNNPDLLDLHYLHVLEAISCLDLFLDYHITHLNNFSRAYKNVFIITGRGLHSAGGVSTIKNKVKSRLKELNLRWTEVNPGLLRVKLFCASKQIKNI